MQSLHLKSEHWQSMREHVQACAPLEACGLLAGKNNLVLAVLFVRNQAESPVRFVMDPIQQLNALDWIDANGLELVGIFHSHPTGPETVSVTDIDEAAYEVVHIVWSRLNDEWQARGFWIENGQVSEVTLEMAAGE
jgi:proteasome lid subunit RPN8/RPN11